MNMRAVFVVARRPHLPVNPSTVSIAGSARMIFIDPAQNALHRLKGGVLVGLDRAHHAPVILLREESLWAHG